MDKIFENIFLIGNYIFVLSLPNEISILKEFSTAQGTYYNNIVITMYVIRWVLDLLGG